MSHLRAVDFEHAAQRVLNEEGAKVADVRRAIDGRAAAVETQGLTALCGERLDRAAESIVELNGHL